MKPTGLIQRDLGSAEAAAEFGLGDHQDSGQQGGLAGSWTPDQSVADRSAPGRDRSAFHADRDSEGNLIQAQPHQARTQPIRPGVAGSVRHSSHVRNEYSGIIECQREGSIGRGIGYDKREMSTIYEFMREKMRLAGIESYAEFGRKIGRSTSYVCEVVRETANFPWKNVNAWGDALGLDESDRKELLRLATEQRLRPSDPSKVTKLQENTEVYDDDAPMSGREMRALRREVAALRRVMEKILQAQGVTDTPASNDPQPVSGAVLGAAAKPREAVTMRPAQESPVKNP
jgi:hypothetical protein